MNSGIILKTLAKKIISLSVCIFLSVGLYAQSLRDYVCVVRGNLSEENKTFLEELKSSLAQHGYTYYSGYINSFLKGTFGSGFIWYAPDGKPYIVTNRHVVSNYENVNLSFENEDGSVSEFKNMKIVYIDDDVDFALVALPDSFKKDGLVFSTKKLTDGEDVFSAGFPGLAGEPSWQLGKGVVSNSSAKIKELLNPQISTIIQHTAQIDGGNSGGPLLVKDSSVKAGYKVCGVNTWRATSRQNTNFSIPVSCINNVVKTKFSNKNAASDNSRFSAFAKAVASGEDFTCVVPFISNECVSKYGEKSLKNILALAPSSVRSYVVNVFEESPIEGLRNAVAYFVYSKFSKEDRVDIGEITDEATGKKVTVLSGETKLESFWGEESGKLMILEFEGLKADKKGSGKGNSGKSDKSDKKKNSFFSLSDPYFAAISGGYLKNLTEKNSTFYLDGRFQYDFIAVGFFITKDKLTSVKDSTYYYSDPEEMTVDVFNFGPYAQLRLPLEFGKFGLIPFAELNAGFSYTPDFGEVKLVPFHFGAGAGLEMSANISSSFAPFIGGKYVLMTYSKEILDSSMIKDNEFVIYAGIKFFEKF